MQIKILVMSHNVFGLTNNMGKTLKSYFGGFSPDELAQFYIKPELPTLDMCREYYRITDSEVLKRPFGRNCGMHFGEKDIDKNRKFSATDTAFEEKMHKIGKKRGAISVFLRNIIWNTGLWKKSEVFKWVDEIKPDIIFFASGNYGFMYKIALEIAEYNKIPLVISCVDDYYINSAIFGTSPLGRYNYRRFMKIVRKTVSYSSCIFTICDKMARDYSELFKKACYVLKTASDIKEPLDRASGNKISYIGNLDFGREKQLVDIGRALLEITDENVPKFIDVYSPETDKRRLSDLTPANGVNFHGKIPADTVRSVMAESRVLVHTESFDKKFRDEVRYSVSTKIADMLSAGKCILAYGPGDIASMEDLKQCGGAECVFEKEKLKESIIRLFSDSALREKLESNTLAEAKAGHTTEANKQILKKTFCNICKTETKK